MQGNAAQLDERLQQGPKAKYVRKCDNCNKPRHFAVECYTPKHTRACQAYIQDYMNQEEDLLEVHVTLQAGCKVV